MNQRPIDNLSERQIKCLQLVSEGLTSKAIARELGLSPSTVDSHISAAIDRLGAKNRVHAARMLQDGLSQDQEQLQESIAVGLSQKSDGQRPIFFVPSVGGRVNKLTKSERVFAILQVAMVAVFIFAAIVFSISGLIHLFVKS